MPENNIAVARVAPEQDLCSCAACGAGNKTPGTDVFDLRAGNVHVRLCRACLEQSVRSAIDALGTPMTSALCEACINRLAGYAAGVLDAAANKEV